MMVSKMSHELFSIDNRNISKKGTESPDKWPPTVKIMYRIMSYCEISTEFLQHAITNHYSVFLFDQHRDYKC